MWIISLCVRKWKDVIRIEFKISVLRNLICLGFLKKIHKSFLKAYTVWKKDVDFLARSIEIWGNAYKNQGFSGDSVVKNLLCQFRRCKRLMFDPWGQEDPLEEKMATHSKTSCLENSMDRGAWWAAFHGVAKSQTQLSGWANTHTHT